MGGLDLTNITLVGHSMAACVNLILRDEFDLAVDAVLRWTLSSLLAMHAG